MTPVSIRTKNPGAMWPGSVATKFGSTQHENLRDGNKAAIFPTYEQGAAAQFYLWSTRYSGLTLSAAIYKWSGHNSSKAYANFLSRRVPNLDMDTVITSDFLSSQTGLLFMKAQAQWEAGKPYPMSDAQWRKGQELAFGGTDSAVEQSPPLTFASPQESPPDQDTAPKSLVKSKTIWGGIGGWITSIGGIVMGFFDKLSNPYTFAAFVIIVILVSIFIYLVIKGRLDVNKVVNSLQRQV